MRFWISVMAAVVASISGFSAFSTSGSALITLAITRATLAVVRPCQVAASCTLFS